MDFSLNVCGGIRFLAAMIGAFSAVSAFSDYAAAQTYPDKPVRVILGFAPGTPPDLAMRRISEPVGAILGQPVLIESKPGAAGVIGAEFVAKSAPDGYTLMAGTLGTHAFNPNLYKALPYDALKDFTPITRIISGGFNTFLVNPKLPANNVPEFVALAKTRAKEGKPLTFGSGGVGSVAHLAVELFKQAAGIELVHIPYKGSSQVVTDVIGGHVDLIVTGPSVTLPLVESGKLKAIAVDTPERQKRMPNVQTMSEAGIQNVELVVWVGVFAPANIPPHVANKLHAALTKALAQDDVKAGFARDGMDIITDESPDAFRRVIAADIEKWGKVIKAANIPLQ
ncbi:tripartite tricarboxylate transporter substrate binding protein [Pseudorhodoplanes sp.]|uniref:Bug family tripartite tricarboxylate transporter substrate binding protein n=1 Tax=Pseudorhodoplanes sp. TaxID=1934341 RepID=UPI002C0A61AF|nr:tripartite tricarboxylate transporter substrate binding protein [Pseudorhodoplanes sp.]HWV52601.1 tripartite tricarboxylate transporter substrate binding protein [Pseudorhodoplanes sp.]